MRFTFSRLPVICLTVLATCILIVSASCSKDEKKPSKTDLISRSWVQVDLLASIPGVPAESVFDDQIDTCDQDNVYEFKSDGTMTIFGGTEKCDPLEPDVIATGNWHFVNNETQISIQITGDVEQIFDIVELTETSAKLSILDTSTGFDITLTGVFQAK